MKNVTVLCLGAMLAGCNLLDFSGEAARGWRVEPGAIVYFGDSTSVELPDVVRAGVPLAVSVTTFGGGCTRVAGMQVDVRGLKATLVPMDSTYSPGPGEACTAELRRLRHRASVTFSRIGAAEILIRGRRVDGETSLPGRELVIRRAVTVIP